MGVMVNPPKPGDISYPKFAAESKSVHESLRRRARMMTDGFNSCRNDVCNFTEGAMYSFPQIRLPPRVIEAAKRAGKTADVFYCLKLLVATGISTDPGFVLGKRKGCSTFGQLSFQQKKTSLPSCRASRSFFFFLNAKLQEVTTHSWSNTRANLGCEQEQKQDVPKDWLRDSLFQSQRDGAFLKI